MLSEDFDKKIKLAAEQHHPAYDEKAWLKMEKLLGRYLPQSNDGRRRRFLLLLFLFVAAGGGAFLLLSRPSANKSSVTAVPAAQNTSGDKSVRTQKDESVAVVQEPSGPATSPRIEQLPATSDALVASTRTEKNILTSRPDQKHVAASTATQFPDNESPDNALISKNQSKQGAVDPVITSPAPDKTSPEKLAGDVQDDRAEKKDKPEEDVAKKDDAVKPSESSVAGQKKQVGRSKNDFSLTVSAGPDVSKAGDSKLGKTTLLYGVGVSYTRNRITLRTGLFMSKKLYWADGDAYKLAFPLPSTTKFEGADADCRIMVIPVKLSYNFRMSARGNWFAGGGLSSYLMKKEKYTYVYKTASGAPYYHDYTTRNENKHYMSILNLSAGYTYRVTRFLSITAEPYAEIPLQGVGVGKVHLNSGGVLFTVGIHPFRK